MGFESHIQGTKLISTVTSIPNRIVPTFSFELHLMMPSILSFSYFNERNTAVLNMAQVYNFGYGIFKYRMLVSQVGDPRAGLQYDEGFSCWETIGLQPTILRGPLHLHI